MAKRENCEHRHTNGNCLFNGGFCLANDEEHCVRMNEIKSYNQALEDVRNLTFRDVIYTDSLNDRTELRELIDELTK